MSGNDLTSHLFGYVWVWIQEVMSAARINEYGYRLFFAFPINQQGLE